MESHLKAMPLQTSTDERELAAARADALRRDTLREALCGTALLAVLAIAATIAAGLGAWFVVRALAVFGLAIALMLRALPSHAPHARFGSANRVTLVRLAMVALLAAGVGESFPDPETAAWAVIGLATTAALMDALDGPLARAQGMASDFGARFDMETDALLVLVLSLLVMHFDKAGGWIMAAGLMRYAFVLAAWALPWIARPLPPSQRRKAVCVGQITSLIVCLGPIIPAPWSNAIAALSLVALTASFAVDMAWLARQRLRQGRRSSGPEPAP